MASAEWLEIYRSYEDDELNTEIAELREAVRKSASMSAQTIGSKSFQRDLIEQRSRLAAATRVSNERYTQGGFMGNRVGYVDFS